MPGFSASGSASCSGRRPATINVFTPFVASTSSSTHPVSTRLYLISLFLIPWTWFPPFPWLHEHAQWADAFIAATVVAWMFEGGLKTLRSLSSFDFALAAYFVFALLSFIFASPDLRLAAPKLVGTGELCALAFITSKFSALSGMGQKIGRVIAFTSIVIGGIAIVAMVSFYLGVPTRFIGIYGELQPSPWYARLQAGTRNPNLLASFCIFAAGVVSRRNFVLPIWFRRAAMSALWLTVFLTFSRGIMGFVLAALIRNAVNDRRKKIAVVASGTFAVLILAATLWRPFIDPTHPFSLRISSGSSRFEAATSSLKTIVSHPLFGSGLATNPGLYLGVPFDAHCTPINIAATLGIPALISFVALIAILWRRRRRPTDLCVWGALAGLSLDGLAQDIEDFRHVWVVFGLAEPDANNQKEN
jgi:hypothetical protein